MIKKPKTKVSEEMTPEKLLEGALPELPPERFLFDLQIDLVRKGIYALDLVSILDNMLDWRSEATGQAAQIAQDMGDDYEAWSVEIVNRAWTPYMSWLSMVSTPSSSDE